MLPSSGPDFCFGCCYLDSFFCALPIILAFVRAQTCLSLPSLSPVHQISAPITGTSSLVNSFPGTSCLPPCLAFVNQLLYSAYLLRCLMHRQLICDSLSFIYSSSCLLNMYWMPPLLPCVRYYSRLWFSRKQIPWLSDNFSFFFPFFSQLLLLFLFILLAAELFIIFKWTLTEMPMKSKARVRLWVCSVPPHFQNTFCSNLEISELMLPGSISFLQTQFLFLQQLFWAPGSSHVGRLWFNSVPSSLPTLNPCYTYRVIPAWILRCDIHTRIEN